MEQSKDASTTNNCFIKENTNRCTFFSNNYLGIYGLESIEFLELLDTTAGYAAAALFWMDHDIF